MSAPPLSMVSRADRVRGGVIGLLLGDALGVPYEFHAAADIPPLEPLELAPPPAFSRTYPSIPPGTWSDDGAQALCLLASLLESDRFDAEDFGARLVRWHDDGELAVDGHVFDVGITTSVAVGALRDGTPALQAGPAGERSNGNGALMRVLPLALFHGGGDAALVFDAEAQSRVTHGHLRSQVCCAFYCLWARRILEAHPSPWAAATEVLRSLYAASPRKLAELESHVKPDAPPPGRGSGYVVDCLFSARDCLARGSYEEVVKAAIRLGDDTDTTACVAGGLAGLRDGESGIPERLRAGLRGKELYEPLLERLVLRGRGVA